MTTTTQTSSARFGAAILAAFAFACTDLAAKVVLSDGVDLITLTAVRGVIGIVLIGAWLPCRASPSAITSTARKTSLALGVVFAANLFFLFRAIEAVEVSIAIVTYFLYPLLTGLAAAALGFGRLTWRAVLAALGALAGLALLIGAHPAGLAVGGIAAAVAAACCRVVMLLVTRARLADTDPVLIAWYSILSSTAIFLAALVVTGDPHLPRSAAIWLALASIGLTTTVGILAVYASTSRIGPFHTALLMNLEPLLTALGGVLLLGDSLTGLQLAGGALMMTSLIGFQSRR